MTKVLFTAADESVIRTEVELPISGPKFLLFRGKLYKSNGSSSCRFYREFVDFQAVENDTDYSRQEFLTLLGR